MRLLFFVALVFFLPSLALARATSFDTLTFRRSPDQGLYLQAQGADLLAPAEWSAGLFLDYAREPLSVLDLQGVPAPVVRDIVGLHLSGSVGLFNWLELGLQPNVALYEKFFDPVSRAESGRVRLGETRLNGKIKILGYDKRLGISFVPYLDLPTGSGNSFVGNNSLAGGGFFSLETPRLEERLTFVLNLGYYARDRVNVQGTPFDDLLTFGIAGNFLVVRWLELIAEFHGGTMASDFFEPSGTPFEGGGGARYYLGRDRRWQLTTAVSAGVGSGLGNPSVRGILGVGYTPVRRVKGVELQESATEAFQVFELKGADEKEEGELELLRQSCPDKKSFDPKKDDPHCLKFYLSQ